MSQTPAEMTEKVLDAGIWHMSDGQLSYKPEGFNGSVQNSHQFAFTEAPVVLPQHALDQMCAIAAQVPTYYRMLQSLGENLPSTGTSSQYKGIDTARWAPPPVTMIDAMITADGEVKIAEVDVINPRGLGYLALYDQLHADAGAQHALRAVARTVREHDAELTVLQGSMQNFYGPYFALLQKALKQSGAICNVTLEPDITVGHDGALLVDGIAWAPSLLLDFPALRKRLKKAYGPLADTIVQAYNEGVLAMLYPPQPHLSSKLLLAHASEQGIFGDHLPKTLLCEDAETARKYLATGEYCIKAAVSSGMKGLWLPGSVDVTGVKFPLVAQGLVADQHVLELTHASGNHKDWQVGKFLARLSLFVSTDGMLLAADITGQPYTGAVRGVHGNPDCVLAPVSLAF